MRSIFWTSKLRYRFIIFTLCFFSSRILVAFLLGSSRAFAPDEAGYVETFKSLYGLSESLGEFRSGAWWATNDFFLRVLYFPALALNVFGIESQTVLRIYSMLISYAAFSLLLFSGKAIFNKLSFWSTFTIAHVPTVILWTTLGLRESFILFALIILYLCMQGSNIFNLSYKIIFGVGVFVLVNTKLYLFIEFYISLCVFLSLSLFMRKFRIHSLLAVVIASICGLTFALGIQPVRSSIVNYANSILIGKPIVASNPLPELAQTGDTKPGHGDASLEVTRSTTERLLNDNLNSGSLAARIILEIKTLSIVSSEKSQNSVLTPANLSNGNEVVKSIFEFLLYPNFFRDNGTEFLNILGIFDFPFWIFTYALFIAAIFNIRGHGWSPNVIIWTMFALVFLIISTTIETNVGTALRHRFILIILLNFVIVESVKMLNPHARNRH